MKQASEARLLQGMEQLAASVGDRVGFFLLSPFADRHGVFESRFVRTLGTLTAFLSFACELVDDQPPYTVCELRSGLSHPYLQYDELQTKRLILTQWNPDTEATLAAALHIAFADAATQLDAHSASFSPAVHSPAVREDVPLSHVRSA